MLLKKDKKRPLKSKCNRPEKKVYNSLQESKNAANNFYLNTVFATKLDSYFCRIHQGYHLGHRRIFWDFDYESNNFMKDISDKEKFPYDKLNNLFIGA